MNNEAFLKGVYECSKEYAYLVKENERLKQIEKEYYKLLKLEFENSGVKFNEKGQVSSIVNVTVEFQEYKQLKRLDENVKKKIAELNYKNLSEVNQLAIDNIIKLLKSLYDE